MPITGWIAILVLIVMCYMLIKQYETRMVLFGGGFILCCISLTPMAGLNAFAKTMTKVAHELGMKNTTFKNANVHTRSTFTVASNGL